MESSTSSQFFSAVTTLLTPILLQNNNTSDNNNSSLWLKYTNDSNSDNTSSLWMNYGDDSNNSSMDITTSVNGNDSIAVSTVKPVYPCYDPADLLDYQTAKTVERMLHMIVLTSLEVFGITTNVINIIVFLKQGINNRINLCLFSLALADVVFLCLIFAAKFFSFLWLFDEKLEEYWSQKYLNTVLGPMLGTMNISNLMTMIISVERCIAVVSPFTAKKFLKTKYMAIVIVTMAVYILGFYSFLDMKYVTMLVYDPRANSTRWVSRLSTFYLTERHWIDILYNHLLSLSIPVLSILVVIVASLITVSRLNTTLAWRQETANTKPGQGTSKSDAGVTKMLMVVCCVYVTTMTLSVTQAFFRSFIPGYIPAGKYCNLFVVVQTLAHVCEVTNSSVNFAIYFSMGTKFRTTVKEMCCCGGGGGIGDQKSLKAPVSQTESTNSMSKGGQDA